MPDKKPDMRETMKRMKQTQREMESIAKRSPSKPKKPARKRGGQAVLEFGSDKKTGKWTVGLKKKVQRALKARKTSRTKQTEKSVGSALTKKELDKMR